MQSPVKLWRNQKKIAGSIGKTGKILAFTLVRVPPGEFADLAPYPVVIVEFSDNTRMCLQLVDWQDRDLHLGRPVRTVIRRVTKASADGVIPYGIKVTPI